MTPVQPTTRIKIKTMSMSSKLKSAARPFASLTYGALRHIALAVGFFVASFIVFVIAVAILRRTVGAPPILAFIWVIATAIGYRIAYHHVF